MANRLKECGLILGLNIFYAIIIYNFLGGVSSISLFYLDSYRWSGLPLWIIYVFMQCAALKLFGEKNRKYIIHTSIFTVCFMLLKVGIDFIWGEISWKIQAYRQIAIVEGVLPYIYEILLILIVFFVMGKEKISWSWKRIKVPGILLILSIISYILFIFNNQFQYSEAVTHYYAMIDREKMDLYFATLIMSGNPWFYAIFAIILWWFMRRLTDPTQDSGKTKKEGTFSFIGQKSQNQKELTALLSTSNDTEAGIIADILKQNGIFTVIRDRESGDVMRLYMGNSIFEKEILVNSGEYDRAKRLIENTYTGTEEDMSEYEDLAKQREIKRRTFLVLAAALIIIFLLLALVIQ